MKKLLLSTLLVTGFGLASFSFNASTTQDSTTKDTTVKKTVPTKVKKNNELPDVSLKDVNGNSVSIKSLGDSGKITVITFWAIWCKPCVKELDNTVELLEEWKKKYNLQYYAVSIDDARTTVKVKPFAASRGWDYKILLDPNRDLARTMNVNNPPMIFIYDETGKQVYTHMGYTEGAEYDVDDKLKEIAKKK